MNETVKSKITTINIDKDIEFCRKSYDTDVDERELGAISGDEINEIAFEEEEMFCPYCWSKLQEFDEDMFVCSNDWCLNDTEYNSEGDIYE